MGRLFVTKIENAYFKCKYCKIEFAAYEDQFPSIKIHPAFKETVQDLSHYLLSKCFNVVIGTDVMIDLDGEINYPMRQVFCISCGSHIGSAYEVADDRGVLMYNEGHFLIHRHKFTLKHNIESSSGENSGNEMED